MQNSKNADDKPATGKDGIGMQNVQGRLALLYNDLVVSASGLVVAPGPATAKTAAPEAAEVAAAPSATPATAPGATPARIG